MHDDSPLRVLNRVFGFERFRGAQAEIIDLVISGGDALVLMPTGGGKSLCYQIPALLRPGTAIVISPLIALMQDQVDALRQFGVRAAFLNSSLSLEQARQVERQLIAGSLDLLYIAPERLLTERFQTLLDRIPLALFAIDEAHCVSKWGHDFRPEYIQLDLLHTRWPQVPRLALTATADTPTRNEIITRLQLEQAQHFVSSFDRPNIRYRIVQKANARQQLLSFLRREHHEDAGIVYCLSRRRVEETAQFLTQKGVIALPYHAGLDADTRRRHQLRFLREDGVIMVATIAFGMGIDKPDVRFVAHLDLPKSLEAYYQETGRAGRDGQPANAWLAYGLGDVVMLRRMIEGSDADEQFKRLELRKLDGMLGFCETSECRRQVLLNYFGETLPTPCGNCDTCLEPVATWDGTTAAQMALSCIYRTGQRFGAGYLADVLLGTDSDRIRQFGHDRVSTFGIGKVVDGQPMTVGQWRSIYRQLVTAGWIAVDLEGHGALRLTEQSRPLLRGEQSIRLRRDPERKTTRATRAAAAKNAAPNNPEAAALLAALRARRLQLAQAQNVAAYVIFPDTTLFDMVIYRPRDAEEFGRISGVGQMKLARFGAEFLEVLAAHEAQHGRPSVTLPLPPPRSTAPRIARARGELSETAQTTLVLFRQGLTPEQIAEKRNFVHSTIYGHLARCIEAGKLALEDVVTVDAETRQRIEFAFAQLPDDALAGSKQVFDLFEGRYSYGLLQCVRAGMKIPPTPLC
ncbi:DNA helicase RecQ [Chromatium okenii]|uniref:DNA helicase RecQ n=1 Tax=Chromatium okenii TaxID=61644 RepID=A0A2S7XMN2_9GAMM|nr:DNA helicase RecQ [Chromatium okenii]PQJ94995.1 DNA helicase RecQ [Chromatium okenii]